MRAENSCEPAGTFAIEYRPSGFVRVPMLSASMKIWAPAIGWPSAASTTVPSIMPVDCPEAGTTERAPTTASELNVRGNLENHPATAAPSFSK